MLDYVIRSGTVIDGTGEPGRLADIGIRDGRIVAIGQIDEAGDDRVRRRRAHRDARVSSTRTRTTTRSSSGTPWPPPPTCTA